MYFYDYNNKRDYKTKLIWETSWESDWKETWLADLEGGGVTSYFIIFTYKEWEADKIYSRR